MTVPVIVSYNKSNNLLVRKQAVSGRGNGPDKEVIVVAKGTAQRLTKGPPAPAACGGLRPNRPITDGAGDERWVNQRKQDLETEGLGPVRRP